MMGWIEYFGSSKLLPSVPINFGALSANVEAREKLQHTIHPITEWNCISANDTIIILLCCNYAHCKLQLRSRT